MSNFIAYILLGLPFGCVFALIAIGLVLTYKTSGVFNLAFGAQAFAAAAVYYVLHVRHGWPTVPAAVLAIVVFSPLIGLILELAIFRHMRTASPLAKMVASLGLLVAVPQMVVLWLIGVGKPTFGVRGIWWDDTAVYHFFFDTTLSGKDMAVIVSTVLAVLVLGALFKWAPIGLRMRAVVESPRMTELSGINADRVSAFSWMLSSLFAGLAGVLIAPYFASLGTGQDFITLLVAAIAVAAFARLRSIPMALLGGILLGVIQGLLQGYLPPGSLLAQYLKPALPFAALFLLLLFWPGLRTALQSKDPLAGVDPPVLPPAAADRGRGMTIATRTFGIGVGIVMFVLAFTVMNDHWIGVFTQGVIFSVIFLSITVITGMGGQISLAQAAFAGIGGYGTAQLVQVFNLPVLPTMLLAALLAGVVGALLAIPTLRLGGIFLSLGTLAFALVFSTVFVQLGWVAGGAHALNVPRPGGLANDKPFLVYCVVVLIIVSFLVILVRKGTTGRYLDALSGSETAAQSIGIDPRRSKIVAFALSAAIAGLGGSLLAQFYTTVSAATVEYTYVYGLFFVVIVVTLSARTVEGAINAGLSLVIIPEILNFFGLPYGLTFILFGLGAITYARHPEGILESQKRRSMEFLEKHVFRTKKATADDGSGPPSTNGADRVPVATTGAAD
ncbi:MAG TPA: ABC transporter permease [Acidimicrobiia bacterium]